MNGVERRKVRKAAAAAARRAVPHICEICGGKFFQNYQGRRTTFCGVECRTGVPQ